MTAKEGQSVDAIIARRAKVAEYKAQYMRNSTIAQLLGVAEKTIERDLTSLREGFEEKIKITGGKDLAHAVLIRHERMLEKIQLDIAIVEQALSSVNSRLAEKDAYPGRFTDEKTQRSLRHELRELRKQEHEIDVTVSRFYQTVGFMPKLADKVDVQQTIVDNPFEGVGVPEDLKKKKVD